MNLFVNKAKQTNADKIPEGYRTKLPKTGLLFTYYGQYRIAGEIVFDAEAKNIIYKLHKPSSQVDKGGTHPLTPEELSVIIKLINIIWETEDESRYNGDLPAKVMSTILVLVEDGKYRMLEFPGLMKNKVQELHEFMLKIIGWPT